MTATMVTMPEGAAEWLRHGERGVSSEAIFGHLTGIPIGGRWAPCTPGDPDDLRRCRLLLDQVPAFRTELPRMAEVSVHWAALVARWDEVCALMDEEATDWRDRSGSAPRTYKLMRQIEKEAGNG